MPKNTLIIDNYHNASTTVGVTLGIVVLIIICILIWYYFDNIKRFFIDLHNNMTDDNIEYSNDVDAISQMKQEVFNVDQNVFTYDEAKVACEALGAKLATKKQMDEAQKDGANWCNNGWVEDQMAMWPIQEGYIKSIKGTHLEGKCGKPGLNGGYQPDKNLKLSANCYGYRPRPNENYIHYLEKIMKNTNNEPDLIDKYRKMFAEKDLFVAPYSDVQWSEFSKYISDYKLGDYYPRDDIESSKYKSVNGNNGNGNNGNGNNGNGNNGNGNNGNGNNAVNGTDSSKLGNSSGTFTGENSLDKEEPSYCDNSKALNYGSLGNCEYEPNNTYESNYASVESGSPESGSPESGSPESGSPESGSPESGSPESGSPESGSPESGSPESGSPESGSPESGSPAYLQQNNNLYCDNNSALNFGSAGSCLYASVNNTNKTNNGVCDNSAALNFGSAGSCVYASVNNNLYCDDSRALNYGSAGSCGYYKFDNNSIQVAVADWLSDPESAEETYGHISKWDVSGVTKLNNLFKNGMNGDTTSFNEDISGWDVSSVTNMFRTFYNAKSFNQDISGWDVSSVTNTNTMFYGATTFNQDISGWDVVNVTNSTNMFINSGIDESYKPSFE